MAEIAYIGLAAKAMQSYQHCLSATMLAYIQWIKFVFHQYYYGIL